MSGRRAEDGCSGSCWLNLGITVVLYSISSTAQAKPLQLAPLHPPSPALCFTLVLGIPTFLLQQPPHCPFCLENVLFQSDYMSLHGLSLFLKNRSHSLKTTSVSPSPETSVTNRGSGIEIICYS